MGPAGLAMREILRADRRAVSPVIATILLVAITVVLAAVLYLMVSGLFNPRNTTARFLGVSLSQPGGADWVLTLASMSSGLTQNNTILTLIAGNGSTALPGSSLYALEAATRGVQYIPQSYGPTNLNVGDRVVISTAVYPSGTQYQFVSAGTVVASGTLH